jgi:hypothetical protein
MPARANVLHAYGLIVTIPRLQLFGATTNNVIKYDTLSNQCALLSDIEHAGVQQALASVGVNVDLSGFNLEMIQVRQQPSMFRSAARSGALLDSGRAQAVHEGPAAQLRLGSDLLEALVQALA